MWFNIFLGCLLMVLTTAVHGLVTRFVSSIIISHRAKKEKKTLLLPGVVKLPFVVLLIFVSTLFESGLWTATYLIIGAFDQLEEALYFSIVTFTTLGFGEITLSEEWRLLSSIEAANGIIIFGWSTAIVMAVVQKTYFSKS
jgi:hypothetical protein